MYIIMSQLFIKNNRNIILFLFYSFVSFILLYFIYSTYFTIDSITVIPTDISNTSDISLDNLCVISNNMEDTKTIINNNPDIGTTQYQVSSNIQSIDAVEESDPFGDYKWDGWEYEYEAPLSHMHSPIYNYELYVKTAPISSTDINDTGNVDVTVVELSDSSNTDNSPTVSEPSILEEQSILADQTPPSIINTHFDESVLIEYFNNLERQSDNNSSDVSDAITSADATISADTTMPANSDPSVTGHFNSFDELVNNNLLGDGEDDDNFPSYHANSDDYSDSESESAHNDEIINSSNSTSTIESFSDNRVIVSEELRLVIKKIAENQELRNGEKQFLFSVITNVEELSPRHLDGYREVHMDFMSRCTIPGITDDGLTYHQYLDEFLDTGKEIREKYILGSDEGGNISDSENKDNSDYE